MDLNQSNSTIISNNIFQSNTLQSQLDTFLLNTGAHIGRDFLDTSPLQYINLFCRYSALTIFKLSKLVASMRQILMVLVLLLSKNGVLLINDNNPVLHFFSSPWLAYANQPFIFTRWTPGTFTNYRELLKILHRVAPRFDKKQSQQKKKLNLRRYYRSLYSSVHRSSYYFLRQSFELPNIIFSLSIQRTGIMLLEASKLGLPVIAIGDSNIPVLSIVTYFIGANDVSIYALYLYLTLIAQSAGVARLTQGLLYQSCLSNYWFKHFLLQYPIALKIRK
jgi:small subunit ribosomal protein S2